MEKKTTGRPGIEQTAVRILKALLCAYIVTGIMLLILTILLYKAGLSEENVNAGIILTYVISTFAGGFVMGKLTGTKKFLWGLLLGVLYFVLLLLISLGVYHTLQAEITNLLTTFLLCAGGGMLGGMVS
ncbi:MAG TPA: TIGR04086 family membrane protein [Candidatus Mediterraneibacter stercorigallinarum]|uniref:TIGR04086 family membrane protein n=1 Tax=Candidatus Mediterraneibacter stercorigallinarum TaxID=2838686 RepID=A0A9D2IK90_9FIRM|nr:TIGR04086 family membrane protein [Candidatus Mediterraneibacter stercorigallinarum]